MSCVLNSYLLTYLLTYLLSPTHIVHVDMTLIRSNVKVKVTGLLQFRKLHFLGLCPVPFWHGAQNWRLIMIVRDLVYSLSKPGFRICFQESCHVSSNFAECRYYTNFKWPYFRNAGGYGHMVGQAGSPMCIVHTDVTLTWSKVNVTDLLNFRKLHLSTSTSSAILAWRSQLMDDYDSMGPSL